MGARAAQGGPLGGPKAALAFRASVGCSALALRPPRLAGHMACGRGACHLNSSELECARSSAALLRAQSIFTTRSKSNQNLSKCPLDQMLKQHAAAAHSLTKKEIRTTHERQQHSKVCLAP